jgi:hypothetical protein
MSKTFAVISGTKVINVLVADTKEDAELVSGLQCVEYTQENPAGIDWDYDSENEAFIAPPIPEPVEPSEEAVPE